MIQTSDLIGKPFKYGGRGPEFYDCYGLILECLKRYNPEGLPPDFESTDDHQEILSIMNREKEIAWKRLSPQEAGEGSILLIKVLGGNTHVGFHLGGNYFLHSWEGSKMVIMERVSFWKHKIEGFYEYAG